MFLAFACALITPGLPGRADDTELFSAAVPPNVLLLVDNSGSMGNVVWHEAFDPNATPSCTTFNNNLTYFVSSDVNFSTCGNTRVIFEDAAINPFVTRWSGRYLNWYMSDAADPFVAEIMDLGNGSFSSCLGGGSFSKYRRSRTTASKHILREVVCQVNAAGAVRFGLAQFRVAGDPDGGFVRVPIGDFDAAQAAALDAAIDDLSPETWTPLGESLFQSYTYFMSRTSGDIPMGVDGITRFPRYQYKTNGAQSNGGPPTVPGSPVQNACQRNFVIVITDGEPTRDDFDQNSNMAVGFKDFKNKLIGDYNPDGENETPASLPDGSCAGCEVALYLDDIAKFMQDNDFRPDLAGSQVIDTYTVGFTTTPFANNVLSKTAAQGNGQFFFSNNAEDLAVAIVSAVADIIEKSQAFTAATVPASRASDGNNFFQTYFIPRGDSSFWEGHLKNFEFDATGQILDSSGGCALVGDPVPCTSGPIETSSASAPPFWDAQDRMPSANARALFVSTPATVSGAQPPEFHVSVLDETSLGVSLAEQPNYATIGSGSSAATDGELADEIVQFVRGCDFGSGPCADRPTRLADIFHSTPIVVGAPNAPINELSYFQFAQSHGTRTKMIYAGSNGGFLHGFVAAPYNPLLVPPAYDRTDPQAGEERMGFMPYPVRQTIKQLPVPSNAHYYGVDGSPQIADAWFPSNLMDVVKSSDEWHTVLVGGLRQGGRAYYALDVTDPDDPLEYPGYLWEFPCENPADTLCNGWRPTLGETWSEPVITRIKVDIGGQPVERWVAIFGAGYDPAGDPNRDGDYDASSGPATSRAGRAILMVDITNGHVIATKRFDPSASDAQADMRYAIPASPSVFDLDFDGYADVVFIGDLGGNVWKWTLSGSAAFSSNESHDLSQPGWPFRKFFQAPSYFDPGTGKTHYKSFFFSPTAALLNGTLRLVMGTGERNDLSFGGLPGTDAENNRLYVVKDGDPHDFLGSTTTISGDIPDLDDFTDNAFGCAALNSPLGFFIRAQDGEKFSAKPIIFLGLVFAPSFTPTGAGDPCSGGGEAALFGFDLLCGTGLFEDPAAPPDPAADRRVIIGVGLPSAPTVSIGPLDSGSYAGGGGGGGGGTPPCSNMVVVVTSDGTAYNECPGNLPSSGVEVESWRGP